MSSSLHSIVVNKPRTLPACFLSRTLNPVPTENVSSTNRENPPASQVRLKNEPTVQRLADSSSSLSSNSISESAQPNRARSIESRMKEELSDSDVEDSEITSGAKSALKDSIDSNEISSSQMHPLDTSFSKADSANADPMSSISPNNIPSTSDANAKKRLVCLYGTACYRKNPQHKIEFSHPGDEDYKDEETQCTSSTDVNGNKPPCWFGTRCYRKNKEHLEQFSHSFSSSGRPKRTTKIRIEIERDTDDSEELLDFSDSDEYEASFIDDGSSDDGMDSEEEVSETFRDSNASEEDEGDKKRKKKASKNKRKKRAS